MQRLTDRLCASIERECQRLVHQVALAIDAHRFDEVGDLFAPDGSFQRVNGDLLSGRLGISQGLRRPAEFVTIHHVSPTLVQVIGPAEARGTTSFVAYAPTAGGAVQALAAAFWDDAFVRTSEAWRIAARRTRVLS